MPVIMHGIRLSSHAHPVHIAFRSISSNPRHFRPFSQANTRMVKLEDLSISRGEEPETIVQQITDLVDNGKWAVCNAGKGLERPFKFKTFKATWVRVIRHHFQLVVP